MRSIAITFVAALTLVCAWPNESQAKRKPDYKKASRHYRKAKAHYKAAKYVKAANAFLLARKYSRDGAMYRLVADAFEKAGKLKEALKYYKLFRDSRKPGKAKKAAAAHVARVAALIAGGGKATAAAPAADPKGAAPRAAPAPARPADPKAARPADPRAARPADARPADPRAARPAARPEARKPEAREKPRARPEVTKARPRPVEEKPKAPPIKPVKKKEPKEPPPSKLELGGWAMIGLTAVLATVAGVMALKVEDAEDQMARLATSVDPFNDLRYPYSGQFKKDFEKYEKDGKMFEKLTWTFAGLAGGAAVTAAVLFTLNHLRKKKKEKEKAARAIRFTPQVHPGGASMGLTLDF